MFERPTFSRNQRVFGNRFMQTAAGITDPLERGRSGGIPNSLFEPSHSRSVRLLHVFFNNLEEVVVGRLFLGFRGRLEMLGNRIIKFTPRRPRGVR